MAGPAGTTPNYGFRFPGVDDFALGDDQIENLGRDVDTTLKLVDNNARAGGVNHAPRRIMKRTSGANIANNVFVLIADWLVETGDDGDGCGITYAAGIFTCATAGLYVVSGRYSWNPNVTGVRSIHLYKDGVRYKDGDTINAPAGGTTTASTRLYAEVYLTAGQTLAIYVFQNSGGVLGSPVGANEIWCNIRKVSID